MAVFGFLCLMGRLRVLLGAGVGFFWVRCGFSVIWAVSCSVVRWWACGG